ncbi:MAG: hypothetical protein IJX05_02245 [Clostridia bacterium]|nr:hypothetical protein [Clostridia bacterium]
MRGDFLIISSKMRMALANVPEVYLTVTRGILGESAKKNSQMRCISARAKGER